MSVKQKILEYIDSAILECDEQIEHAFKPESILQDWAEIDIRTAMQRKHDLVKFRALFDSALIPKGKVEFETYSKIMCEAVETIVSYEN